MSRILVGEDERHISGFVEKGLRAAGYSTTTAEDGETALLLGFEVLRRLRSEQIRTPVVILTARDSVHDTVAGLEGGANDYMTKPFQFAELLARIRLRLRDEREATAPGPDSSTINHGELSLQLHTRRVATPAGTVDLTAREFALMEVFMRHPRQVLSREQILGHVWGYDFDSSSNVVDVFVRALRAKIGADRIETVRGAGYRLR